MGSRSRSQSRSVSRRRLVGVAAVLVAAAASLSLTDASISRGSGNPSTAAPTPPALPCPPSGHSVDAKAMAPPASASPGVSWAGVFERIFVKTDMNGDVSGTPSQLTYVSATGQGHEKTGLFGRHRLRPINATVKVPMSSSHLHRRSTGKKPTVVNGVAQVKLKLKGSAVERLKSDYERPLPVTLKVTYRLNGKPIAANDVKHKHGTVEVDYQLTNTTAKPVNVCFKGFNGAIVKKTVTEPAPIYAYFYLTLPKNVTKFSAPGAFLNADISGVEPQWLIALFEPLGPTTQTLKVTMDTRRAKIPKAKLILEFVEPEALTGSAPAQTATAVGQLQAATEAATTKVQADIAALELKAAQPRQPHAAPHSSRGASHGTRGSSRDASSSKHASRGSSHASRSSTHVSRGKSSRDAGDSSSRSAGGSSSHARRSPSGRPSNPSASSLSFGTSTASLAQMQSQLGNLGTALSSFVNAANVPTAELTRAANQSASSLNASTARSIDELAAGTTRSIDNLTKSTSRSIENLASGELQSINRLASDLRSADSRSPSSATADPGPLEDALLTVETVTGRLVPAVSALTVRLEKVVATLPPPLADAVQLTHRFDQLNRDLDALAPEMQSTPSVLELVADVAIGQMLAKTVSNALSEIQTRARALANRAQTLTHSLEAATAKLGGLRRNALVAGRLTGKLVPAVSALTTRLQNLQATLPTPFADAEQLDHRIGQLNLDLNALAPDVQSAPAFLELKADVTAIEALAKTASESIGGIRTQARALGAADVQSVQSDVASLQADIGTLVAAAVTDAQIKKQALFGKASTLEAHFALDARSARKRTAVAVPRAQHEVAAAQERAKKQVKAAQRGAHEVVSSAAEQVHHSLAASEQSTKQTIAAAESQANKVMASVRQKSQADLAAAKAKAKQGGQATLESVQASAEQAESAAKNALSTANDDYARLLGLNQQAVAWALPGGDATLVTEQAGSLIYTIAGS